MDSIVVVSQNVRLASLSKLKEYIKEDASVLVLSTQLILENEVKIIEDALCCQCQFLNFSDILTDAEEEECDVQAYNEETKNSSLQHYYNAIKEIKNGKIVKKVDALYPAKTKLIVCDDLGLDLKIWRNEGYVFVPCEYYYMGEEQQDVAVSQKKRRERKTGVKRILKKIKNRTYDRYYIRYKHEIQQILGKNISVAYNKNQKYLFFGSLNRISYRMDIQFKPASTFEKLRFFLDKRGVNTQPRTIRLSTLHEGFHAVPDKDCLKFKLIQDGYLPPNYTSKYLYYYGKHTEYYTWDSNGKLTFQYHNLPSRIMPFRKKLYLPYPSFPSKIKKILCVASGAGDWTAIKNRSDEDKMLQVFGKVASLFSDIQFIYRCHPVWIHPEHQGVNSIIRAAEYIDWLKLPNFKISCNIPTATDSNGNFILSYQRSSLDEDLLDVDIVFGEHSISMIDAAFKKILFCSVNVTGRRNLFEGITKLGFPHCESLHEIVKFLEQVTSPIFQNQYIKAIQRYNSMTDEEE